MRKYLHLRNPEKVINIGKPSIFRITFLPLDIVAMVRILAVLIQGEDLDSSGQKKDFALTAFGLAQEVGKAS